MLQLIVLARFVTVYEVFISAAGSEKGKCLVGEPADNIAPAHT